MLSKIGWIVAVCVLAVQPASAVPASDDEKAVANYVCYVLLNDPQDGERAVVNFIQKQGGMTAIQARELMDFVSSRWCPSAKGMQL